MSMDVDEYKLAKTFVKTSIFLQFLIHIPMWCHFNGMLMMENMNIEKSKMRYKIFQYQGLV
jgi:hypothetical protein